jgi:hypothetical protein
MGAPARAEAKGVELGREPPLMPHQKSEPIKRRNKAESPAAIAWSYNVSRWANQKLITDHEK